MKKLVLAACLMLFSTNLFAQEIRYYLKDGESLDGNKISLCIIYERGSSISRIAFSDFYLHKDYSMERLNSNIRSVKNNSTLVYSYDVSLSSSSYDVYKQTSTKDMYGLGTNGTFYTAISKDKKTVITWAKGREDNRSYYALINRSELENACKPKAVNTDFLND